MSILALLHILIVILNVNFLVFLVTEQRLRPQNIATRFLFSVQTTIDSSRLCQLSIWTFPTTGPDIGFHFNYWLNQIIWHLEILLAQLLSGQSNSIIVASCLNIGRYYFSGVIAGKILCISFRSWFFLFCFIDKLSAQRYLKKKYIYCRY